MTDVTFISLFSGIGGLDLGLERAGFKCVLQCEKERACHPVLRRHFPGVELRDDVCALRGSDLPVADVWAFGSPCQDNSQVRPGAVGLNGAKSGLAWEVVRLVRESDAPPPFLLWENVDGAYHAPRAPGLARWFCALAELGYSYAAPFLVRGTDVGVPQHRPRWFTLLSPSPIPEPCVAWEPALPRVQDLLDLNVDHGWEDEAWRAKRLKGIRAKWSKVPRRREVLERLEALYELRWPEVRVMSSSPSWCRDAAVAPTLLCDEAHVAIPGRGIRRLTTAERVRLTGLPDEWLDGCSEIEATRMTGNAVIPAAAEIVGRWLNRALV